MVGDNARRVKGRTLAASFRTDSIWRRIGSAIVRPDVNSVRQARRKYGETSLALLDFLDAHDRASLVRYQDEIGKLNVLVEERKRVRAELEKLLAP